ncbi:uncharacterized serine-rich protein C215.13-like [Acropora millepora]|uniref:uncharacterized serine-rich protein C215.13-like n=1 Tax=Acropora millepora TaxID=45264 RepID=UPI001CF4F51D|nr:uncharacterized serine-rich protein C215.13-like [Acropora millepora]
MKDESASSKSAIHHSSFTGSKLAIPSHSSGFQDSFSPSLNYHSILPSSTSNEFEIEFFTVSRSVVSTAPTAVATEISSSETRDHSAMSSKRTSTVRATRTSDVSWMSSSLSAQYFPVSSFQNSLTSLLNAASSSNWFDSGSQTNRKWTVQASNTIQKASFSSSVTQFYIQSSLAFPLKDSSRSSRLSNHAQTTSLSSHTKNLITGLSTNYTAANIINQENLMTSSKKEFKSKITTASLVTSRKQSLLGDTGIPTQTRELLSTEGGGFSTETGESPTTEGGDRYTGQPATVTTKSDHVRLLIIVATVPSIILCVFFAAVLLLRRNRRRRNNFKYSIKLEYRDDSNVFRSKCLNSSLDLSLKGIHIDLEFPNTAPNKGHSRDSPGYSCGPNMADIPMRELQLLSEVIARDMETSRCGCGQPANGETVHSVKENRNYEHGEKIIRRGSYKRGRESVKWKIPIVRRRDSPDYDQRESMCTDETSLTDTKSDSDFGIGNYKNVGKSRRGKGYSLVSEDSTNKANDVSIDDE